MPSNFNQPNFFKVYACRNYQKYFLISNNLPLPSKHLRNQFGFQFIRMCCLMKSRKFYLHIRVNLA